MSGKLSLFLSPDETTWTIIKQDELMPKEKRENFENCKHDMKLDDDKAMKEYCKNPGEYESKFQEVRPVNPKAFPSHDGVL